jgi:hypothetical protein
MFVKNVGKERLSCRATTYFNVVPSGTKEFERRFSRTFSKQASVNKFGKNVEQAVSLFISPAAKLVLTLGGTG